ncbi:DUF2147 domain-containing protein [Methylovirgula sp. 4M-Z18]|uniref:DUF2147 domain-containing protein n=1 Tax=Methylovirgula sp. 4M-Z18 TaxID=2293567 RepID=UPI0013148985|nr:DUF2147 domain-containing protein [Methylovirgula sp. 4M-Z18]
MTRTAFLAAAMTIGFVGAAQAADISGLWLNDDRDAAIEISACGNALCGHIVWLKAPLDAAGKPAQDVNNPDAASRIRPLCGLQVIADLAPQSDGTWDNGHGYDPDSGKSYTLSAQLSGPDTLDLRGYVGMKLMGETETMTRAPKDLPRCKAGAK